MQDNMITKNQLMTNRDWTRMMITELLDNPDKEKVNPFFKSAPTMKLYDLDRIIKAESTEAFESMKASNRREGARKAVETKRRKAVAYIQELRNIGIPVRRLKPKGLRYNACKHYNDFWVEERGQIDKYVSVNDDLSDEFLQRIEVNYIRHELTPYEEKLEEVRGKVGAEELRFEIRKKILGAIANSYPDLVNECKRQMEDPQN